MRERSLSAILMVVGTAILLVLLLSPVLLAVFFLLASGEFLFDYLLTAELGLVACVGALSLTIGTMARRIPAMLLFIFLPLMLVTLFILMVLSDPSPLFAGFILILYNLSLIGLAFHGINSLRH
ncbi:hypothetical protein [Sphaerochaeta sp. S2]|uniref:hypothetical protein n=1 Tax=Sphaerochaeta sp. S2 TaxID=2798868 RepID=UPI0018E969BD|nr:hypothetical protein [Sphaerochaeta sp. S2]MBJ2356558.1 hypothetical protein [Sphaerochaeta sp. S2]